MELVKWKEPWHVSRDVIRLRFYGEGWEPGWYVSYYRQYILWTGILNFLQKHQTKWITIQN
jgi:hypothetical protein